MALQPATRTYTLNLLGDCPQTLLRELQLGLYPLRSTLLSPAGVICDFRVIGSRLTRLLDNFASAAPSLLSRTPSSLGFLNTIPF